MARKKKFDDDESSGGSWLDTFADCVTLLLTFFVVLYSMSSVNEEKLAKVAAAFKSIMAGESGDSVLDFDLSSGDQPLVGGSDMEITVNKSDVEVDTIYQEVKAYVDENSIGDLMDIAKTERGVEIRMRDYILFESGKAVVREESKVILDKVSEMLRALENRILVEGHTDNVPIKNSTYPSNWELSTARAVNVVKYFIENNQLNPQLLSAAGYGEYHPIVENDTEENKARNRRVNILILKSDSNE